MCVKSIEKLTVHFLKILDYLFFISSRKYKFQLEGMKKQMPTGFVAVE
jgi:hypothetical protein